MSDTFLTDTLRAELAQARPPRDRSDVRIYNSACGDLLEVRDSDGKPSGCRRKLYLDFFPERVTPEPFSFESSLNFLVGDAYHSTIEKLLQTRGVLVASEIPLKEHQANMSGRLDWLVRHPTRGFAVADGKSMASWAFKNKEKPAPADIAQVHSYFEAAEAWCRSRNIEIPNGRIEWGCVLYYSKEKGDVEECWFRRSDEIVDAVKSAAAELADKVRADRALNLFDPPAMPEGVKSYSWPCSWAKGESRCKFFGYCHPEKAAKSGDDKPFKLKG